jgi:hypothetical protein
MIDDKLTRSEDRNHHEGYRECDKYDVYILKALGKNNKDIDRTFPDEKTVVSESLFKTVES